MEPAALRIAVLVLTGVIVALLGVLLGAWWTPFFVGAAFGLIIRRPAVAIPLGTVSGLLAWLFPLAGAQLRYGLGPTSVSLAEIMGFDHQGTLPVVLTLLVGTLLGLTGAWLACAVGMIVRPQPR
ncbi:MAG: hypothetical protein AUI15_40230 [Actinobacteria bacterium 13_2_20CM_2_66_6]|nr:MAG: hypothetical protein AUI15_40230 [Actinobacteria bacterium 13_2_20CM_2_66_6]